jgi:hypothetical protein
MNSSAVKDLNIQPYIPCAQYVGLDVHHNPGNFNSQGPENMPLCRGQKYNPNNLLINRKYCGLLYTFSLVLKSVVSLGIIGVLAQMTESSIKCPVLLNQFSLKKIFI